MAQEQQLTASRIDMLFIPEEMVNMVEESEIEPAVRTDHSLVCIVLKLYRGKRSKGLWKFNNLFLQEEEFKEGIHKVI